MVGATDRVHICLRSSTMVEEYIWYNRIRAQWQIPETRRDRQWCRLVAPIKPVFHSLQNITATTKLKVSGYSTAGPIWPPIVEQGQLFAWGDVAGETTAGRRYWPRGEASEPS